jgi:putative zinc finger/helix-turn-helix YgiT family protein
MGTKGICPICEKAQDLEWIEKKEIINVRGEPIKVDAKYFKCPVCGEEWEDPTSDYDSLEEAYREYRKRHGLMQPEEIRNLRKRYNLTQSEMSRILGWGGATLSRYENGALQDEAHERTLRLIEEPESLLKLIQEHTQALPAKKRENLIKKLEAERLEKYTFERFVMEHYTKYEPDVYNGYLKFNLKKFIAVALFFCKEGIFKTRLNKLLFYADFKYFKEYGVSITGARYAHLPYGPTPDKHEFLCAGLISEDLIEPEEVVFSDDIIGEKYSSKTKPDLSLFNECELETLINIKKTFRNFTAKEISEFSHKEKGYKETSDGQLISYDYASDLQI